MTDRVDMGAPDFALLEPLPIGDYGVGRDIVDSALGPASPLASERELERRYEFLWALRTLTHGADVLIYLRQEESDV